MRAIMVTVVLCVSAILAASPSLAADQVTAARSPWFACATAARVEPPPPLYLGAAAGDIEQHARLCPAGQVPQPIGRVAPKGFPGRDREPGAMTLDYFYDDAREFRSATQTTGQYAQARPRVAAGDYHSLAEIAGESEDGAQIIEIGWTVDPSLNGDAAPHLFVFHWVDGLGTCYNACGFKQVSQTRVPGMAVTVTAKPQLYGFRFHQNKWWVAYQGEWIGYFPASLWQANFKKLGLVQWFGEVAAGSDHPCTDMGDGKFGTKRGSAVITGMNFGAGAPASAVPFATDARYYTIGAFTGSSYRFGGPGAC